LGFKDEVIEATTVSRTVDAGFVETLRMIPNAGAPPHMINYLIGKLLIHYAV